ncbi:MAG: phosphoribosylamine---glycine ligase [Chloroflexota bacterium]|jgi:phosphoribosylamine--glycine ligase|nr:phosphoribosylamine---glycine ligase [Chloroflexota bacterium]
MKVLVLGSGGREHALFWKCLQSPQVETVYAAPGNGATSVLNVSVDLRPTDPAAVLRAVEKLGIDLTVIGPDDAVAAGVANVLGAAGKAVFGPTAEAGRVESSKAFAKEVMAAAGIPTPGFAVFDDAAAAREHARASGTGLVVKADGLALGKGVLVCDTVEETEAAIGTVMEARAFGDAGARVILEERVSGPEVSLMCFCDGEVARPMVPARDYKRVGDGDTGPNTGGMGVYSPPSDFGPGMVDQVVRTCAQPLLDELKRRGTPYSGCLYVQVMLTDAGPQVIEYNARFGDPEAQVVLPRLETDLVDLMMACTRGGLAHWEPKWSPDATVGVVLASGGYPGKYATDRRIEGLSRLDPGVIPFHAGTRYAHGGFYTGGGRVLTLVARGADVVEARAKVYENLERVSFDGSFYRRDIAAMEVHAAGAATEG